MSITQTEEAAQILTRILECLARLNGKTLSAKTRGDIARACELLSAGDDLEELLDDLPRVTQSFERPAYGDPDFERWRQQRYDDTR